MQHTLSKTKYYLMLIALFSTSIVLMADFILSPTINALYQLFPNATLAVNFIVSGSYIVIVFTSPIAGKLCNQFGTKPILVAGILSATIGGVLFMLFENPIWMCCMRLFYTIGYGFVQISAVTAINQMYLDNDKKRSTLMGYYHAMETGSGAVLGIIAGNLAVNISTTYQMYWVFVPILLLVLLFLPHNKAFTSNEIKKAEISPDPCLKKERFGISYFFMLIIFGLFHLAYAAPNLFVSVYIAENHLGTPALTGYLNTTCTVCGFVMALLFGKLYHKFKGHLLIIPFTSTLCGLLLLWLFPSVPTSFLAFACFGASNIVVFTFAFTYFPTLAPASRAADSAAGVTTTFAILMVATSYICTWLMNLMGGFTKTLAIYTTVIFILLVAEIIRCILCKKIFSKPQ